MDNIEQITSAGTWVAQYPDASGDGWREEPLACWALIRSDGGGSVVGMIVNNDGHLELVDEAEAFGGYKYARVSERRRQLDEDATAKR